MAFTSSDSAIKVTSQLEEKLRNASFEDMKDILGEEAVAQGLATRDWGTDKVLIPTALADHASQRFKKEISINGVKHSLEAGSADELAKAESDVYRAIFKSAEPARQVETNRDPATGRFVEQPPVADSEQSADKDALALQLSLGTITMAEYLEKSDAVGEYLERRGVKIEDLQTTSHSRIHDEWASATETFLNSPASRNWPGGERNREILANIIQQHDLPPSADSIARAVQYAVENNLLVESPELVAQQVQQDLETRISAARTSGDLQDMLFQARHSGLFNR